MDSNKLFDKAGNTKWIVVNSSNLFAIKYNMKERVLHIQFGQPKPVSQYAYKNVSLSQYTALLQAPSHGHWFSLNIRNRPEAYPYRTEPIEDVDESNASWNVKDRSLPSKEDK